MLLGVVVLVAILDKSACPACTASHRCNLQSALQAAVELHRCCQVQPVDSGWAQGFPLRDAQCGKTKMLSCPQAHDATEFLDVTLPPTTMARNRGSLKEGIDLPGILPQMLYQWEEASLLKKFRDF